MAEAESEELEEDYEQDLIDSGLVGILDMLNFKIVSKEPGDPDFSQLNEVIPPESRQYAAEYVRLQDKYDKLKKEMADIASSSELKVREELTETKESLERERRAGEEAKEVLLEAQREVEESKEALGRVQTEVEELKETLARAQMEGEESKKTVAEEQGKAENLRAMVSKMQEQLNEGEKKNNEHREEQEKLEQLISSANEKSKEAHLKIIEKEKEIEESLRINEELREQIVKLGEISKSDKENMEMFQKKIEKLEEDLRESASTNAKLEDKLSEADAANSELQGKLDALQVKMTELEDKLKQEIKKCGEYKTALEETTSKVNTQERQLLEAADIMTELSKAEEKYEILKTQFETVVQLNLGLDEQVADLQRRLMEKTSEIENAQRDFNAEKDEKIRMQAKLTKYRETLQSCNLELMQFSEELKNTIGFPDEEGLDPCPSTLQSRLESLSVYVKSKLKSREDNLKLLQSELTNTKQTILSIHEHLRRQSVERMAMPPPPPPPASRRAIMPSPQASVPRRAIMPSSSSSSDDSIAGSYRDICRPHELEAFTEPNMFSDFDFPSLEISHGIIATSFGDSDFGAMDTEEVTLIGCRECGRTFSTWAELYQHQKTVHTVQMSKKVVQRRATSVKSLFGTFFKKQKKKKGNSTFKINQRKKEAVAIPKIKIKQRKTRSGAYWNIVAPSPAPSIMKDGGENRNENTLMTGRILSPTPEPIDQNSENDDQNASLSNQNREIESPQHRSPLIEVSNSTAVGAGAVVQPQQHGIDITKSRNGSYCLCGQKCKDKYQLDSHVKYYTTPPKFSCKICGRSFKKSSDIKKHLASRKHKIAAKSSTMKTCILCGQKFYTQKQLRRHNATTHAQSPQSRHATGNHNQPDCQQNVEGSQDFMNEPSNINSSATPAPTTSTSKNSPKCAAELHGVDTSKQDHGAFCICGGKYSSKANLDVHIGYFTLDWKFECGICSQRFYYLTYLRRHYAESHQEPNILDEFVVGCRMCGEMFRSWAEYRIHYRQHLKSKKNETILKTTPRTLLERRQPSSSQVTTSSKKTHFQDISKEHLGLFCVCGFQAVDQSSLTKHIAQYSGDKKFDCNVCHQKFKLLNNLQSHLKVAHNAKKVLPLYGCRHCGKMYLAQSELLNHAFRDHPIAKRKRVNKRGNSTTGISKPTSDRVVPPQSSSQHDVMDIDITRIKIEQSDSELGAVTGYNTILVKHGIDYAKARLGFYCKCGVKTSGRFAKHNLQKHIIYFKTESHFGCPQCQLSFKSTSRVRRHMRSIHNLDYTLVGCSKCGNVFGSIEALREHKKSQHSRKRKRIKVIDLTNIPSPPPQRTEEDLEELQQDDEVTTAAAQTTTQKKILPLSLPTLPKKKHGKDMSKRHLGFYCVCGTKTRSATALHGHITYFTSDKKFECELCGHRSLYLAQLKQHLKSTHKLTNPYQLDLMGKGCSLCGKRGFTTLKELMMHKVVAHSLLNDSTIDPSSTGNQTDCVEPQPSTSKGVLVSANDRASLNSGHLKNPSIVISTKSFSITPVVSTRSSSILETLPTTASTLNLSQADTQHAMDKAKLNAGLFVCICGHTTNNRTNLWTHVHDKTAEKTYACPFCNKKFIYMAYLRKHTKRSHRSLHNPDLSGCTLCSKVFSSKRELLAHSLSMHSTQSNMPGGLQVPQQPILTTSLTAVSSSAIIQQVESASSTTVWVPVTPSISVSLRTPTSGSGVITLPNKPSNFHLEPSSSSFSAAGAKNDEDMIIDAHLTYEPCIPQVQHEINHEMLSNGFYYCLCGLDFVNTHALNRHVRDYSSEGKFICKTCGHAFLYASYLRNHMLRVHKIVYNISNGCKHCGKNFPTNMQLYEHFRVEHNNGHMWEPREQKYTPPTTSQPQLLSQESPYSQEEIIEIQDQNAQLKSYEEKHAMEEQDPLCENTYFSCKCGVRFHSFSLLKRHIRDKKKQYIFKCYICPSTFNTHSNLKGHVVRVHKVPYEKGKYSCRVCAETFETLERMKTHKKDIHKLID